MTIVIPAGYCQISINFEGPTVSGEAVVTSGWSLGEEGTLIGLCQLVGVGITDHIMPYMHDAFTLTSVSGITATEVAEFPVAYTGEKSGDLAPPQVSLLTRKVSALRGRANRGRNYWPGLLLDTDIADDGTITNVYVTTLQGAFDAYGAEFAATNYSGCILHNDALLAPTDITGYIVENRVATQRRRLR